MSPSRDEPGLDAIRRRRPGGTESRQNDSARDSMTQNVITTRRSGSKDAAVERLRIDTAAIATVFFLVAAFVALDPAATVDARPPAGPESFLQERAESFGVSDGLPDARALAVAVTSSGTVYCGTSKGLVRLDAGRWTDVEAVAREPVSLLAAPVEGSLLVGSAGALLRLTGGRKTHLADLPSGVPRDLATASSKVALAMTEGRYHLRGAAFHRDGELTRTGALRDVAIAPDGSIAVASESGLFLRRAGRWQRLPAPSDVRAVDFTRKGRLWFSAAGGVGHVDGERLELLTGADGIPILGAATLATFAEDGAWFGSSQGAMRLDGPHREYRQGRRWLPSDDVAAVAVAPNGDAWLATANGVARIFRRPMTFSEKARFYENEIDRRHRRTPYGFVLSAGLAKPGDRSSWTNRDSDNDGLWTSMYGAGECFAWAATKDPRARERATRAFEALKFLGDVTQGGEHPAPPGFVARTIVPTSGPDPNAGRLERDRRFRETRDRDWKIIDPRWPRSADGKWYWKCDTSSDELDGHYFFYARYHDLVADTEAEKRRVRDVVTGLTDHLMAHGFNLVDHDGRPTRWGHFGPEDLNHNPHWWEERGLNSMSMLSYLKVAHHVSGDAKYENAARNLIDEHGYGMNVLYPKNQTGVGTGNQSDDEMAFMGFYNLLLYERDPRLRRIYAFAFHRYWQLERAEMNPLFDFLYAAVTRNDEWSDPWGTQGLAAPAESLRDALDTLRRFPLDLADWSHTNSRRADVVALTPPWDGTRLALPRRGMRRSGKVIPVDERYVEHWNHDPFKLDTGGSGRTLADGTSFLLPYYLGLHHGFVPGP